MFFFTKFTDEILKIRWIIMGVIVFVFLYIEKQKMLYEAIEKKTYINFFDFILASLSNIYLILYFIIPYLLFISVKNISNNFNYNILIRFSSYRKWLLENILVSFMYILSTFTIWLTVSIILALNLKFTFQWSESSSLLLINNPTVAFLSQYFNDPLTCILLQICILGITVLILMTSLSAIYIYIPKIKFQYLLVVLIFLFGIVSYRLFPENINIFRLPNYLLLYHGIYNFESIYWIFIYQAIASIIIYFCVYSKDRTYMFRKIVDIPVGLSLYILLLIFATWAMTNSLYTEKKHYFEIFIELFYGTNEHGYGYFSYLYYIIIFLGYIYFILIVIETEISSLSFYKLIRHKNYINWFKKLLKSIILNTVVFLFFIFILSISMIFAANYFKFNFNDFNIQNLSIPSIVYHFFVNGFLQLMLYVIVALNIKLFIKDSSVNLLYLGLLIALLMLGNPLIPIGLNSYGHILQGVSSVNITLILLFYILIGILFINMQFKRNNFL